MAIDPSKGFNFDFSKGLPYNELKLEGDTHWISYQCLRFTKTDDHSNPLQWSTGRAIYSKPVPFGNYFENEVQFKVTQFQNTRCGDGFAFFIVPEGYKYPTFGILGRSGVFAVVFDIDSSPGYITLGICISERTPKASVSFLADSFLDTDLTLKVSYDSVNNLISASVSNGNLTHSVSFPYNLSNFLPPMVEVGFGSSTSEYVAVHDAFFWGFKSVAAPQATS